jgi:hypothetical protein
MLRLIKDQIHLSNKWLLRARASFPWSRIVKDPKAMVKALNKVPLVVAGKRSTTWSLALVAFARRSNQIQAKQGLSGLAKYLKVCKLMLMQSLAMPTRKLSGQVIGGHAVAKTKGGLPRIIPVVHRKAIRRGDALYIQFWMTLFSLYKVFELKPVYKLHTIFRRGKPESELEATGLFHGMDHFKNILFSKSRTLADKVSPNALSRIREPEWFFEPLPILMKVTPNTLKGEIAFFNSIRDAKVWVKHPLFPLLKAFAYRVENRQPGTRTEDAFVRAPGTQTPGESNGSYVQAIELLEKMGQGKLLSIGGKKVQAHNLVEEMKEVPSPLQFLKEERSKAPDSPLPLNSSFYEFFNQIANADLSKGLDPTKLWVDLVKPAPTEFSNPPVTGLYESVVNKDTYPEPSTDSPLQRVEVLTKDRSPLPKVGSLGRLGLKNEPNGKVRVFAMVDWWTQSFMAPLHKWLFSLLKTIKEDATFNQDRAVRQFTELAKARGLKEIYSFDLSAATDRLPILIQIKLLGSFISERTAALWATLLVGRGYRVPKKAWRFLPKGGLEVQLPSLFSSHLYKTKVMDYASKEDILRLFSRREKGTEEIYYKVGAPMGCLSNWAMLALTHHYLVQSAAKAVGYNRWFDEYLVLGDDIVIGNTKVALEYQQLMLDIGVPINRSKSLLSDNGSFEFASQFVHKATHNCSPFSMDEITVAKSSLPGLLLLLSKLRRHPKITLKSVLQFMGFSHEAISVALRSTHYFIEKKMSRLMQAIALMLMPGTSPWSKKTYTDWIRATSIGGPLSAKPIEPAKTALFEKELLPFFEKLSSMEFIGWEQVFVKTSTSQQEESLFRELMLPLLDKWEMTRAEAMGSLFESQFLEANVEFEYLMTRYIDASAELAKTPMGMKWTSLQDNSFKPNVGRWLRMWLRLWTSVHHPNWYPRNQHIRMSRLKDNPKLTKLPYPISLGVSRGSSAVKDSFQ